MHWHPSIVKQPQEEGLESGRGRVLSCPQQYKHSHPVLGVDLTRYLRKSGNVAKSVATADWLTDIWMRRVPARRGASWVSSALGWSRECLKGLCKWKTESTRTHIISICPFSLYPYPLHSGATCSERRASFCVRPCVAHVVGRVSFHAWDALHWSPSPANGKGNEKRRTKANCPSTVPPLLLLLPLLSSSHPAPIPLGCFLAKFLNWILWRAETPTRSGPGHVNWQLPSGRSPLPPCCCPPAVPKFQSHPMSPRPCYTWPEEESTSVCACECVCACVCEDYFKFCILKYRRAGKRSLFLVRGRSCPVPSTPIEAVARVVQWDRIVNLVEHMNV